MLLNLCAGGPIDLQDARSIIAMRKPDGIDRESLIAQADALGLAHEVRTVFGSGGGVNAF